MPMRVGGDTVYNCHTVVYNHHAHSHFPVESSTPHPDDKQTRWADLSVPCIEPHISPPQAWGQKVYRVTEGEDGQQGPHVELAITLSNPGNRVRSDTPSSAVGPYLLHATPPPPPPCAPGVPSHRCEVGRRGVVLTP